MYFYQRELESKGIGPDRAHRPTVAGALRELLFHQLKGIGYWGHAASQTGFHHPETDRFLLNALGAITGGNPSDTETLTAMLVKGSSLRDLLRNSAGISKAKQIPEPARFQPAESLENLVKQGRDIRLADTDADTEMRSLNRSLLNSLKQIAEQAAALSDGSERRKRLDFMLEALALMCSSAEDGLLQEALTRCGNF